MLTMSTDKNLRIILNLIGKTEDSRQGHSISDNSERLLARCKGGTRIYRSFQKRAGSWNIKRLLLFKENEVSQKLRKTAFFFVLLLLLLNC